MNNMKYILLTTSSAAKSLAFRRFSADTSGKLMKAAVLTEFGKPDTLSVANVSIPVPGKSQILIRVEAAGINPVDAYLRQGLYKDLPVLPTILGKEVAGFIEQIGPETTLDYNLKVGDRVFARLPNNGGYAEYATAHVDHVAPLPDSLSFSQGASLYVTYCTAYRALILRSLVKENDTLLIHGATGGVGTAAMQIAKHLGVKKIGATYGTPEGEKLLVELGAHFTFNHRKEGHLYEAKLTMGDKGFDYILENAADIYLGDDCNVLAPGGRIAIVGCRGKATITPRSLMATEGRVFGVSLAFMSVPELKECTGFLLDGIDKGWIRPIVGKEYPLDYVREAHHDVIMKTSTRGKLVFLMDHGRGLYTTTTPPPTPPTTVKHKTGKKSSETPSDSYVSSS